MKTKTLLPNLRKGFTLIELLVVIAVIAILATIAVPAAANALTRAKTTKSIANMGQIASQIIVHGIDEGVLPGNLEDSVTTSSNTALYDLFRNGQLDAGGKPLFQVNGITTAKNKNSDISSETAALPTGACAYDYVLGVPASGASGTPILMDVVSKLSKNTRNGVALVANLSKDVVQAEVDGTSIKSVAGASDATDYTSLTDAIYNPTIDPDTGAATPDPNLSFAVAAF